MSLHPTKIQELAVCFVRDAFAQVAQLVEQRTENPCVASSILALGTKVLLELIRAS